MHSRISWKLFPCQLHKGVMLCRIRWWSEEKGDFCKLPRPVVPWLSSYARRAHLSYLPSVLVYSRGQICVTPTRTAMFDWADLTVVLVISRSASPWWYLTHSTFWGALLSINRERRLLLGLEKKVSFFIVTDMLSVNVMLAPTFPDERLCLRHSLSWHFRRTRQNYCRPSVFPFRVSTTMH